MAQANSFGARADLSVGGSTYEIFRIDAVPGSDRLPMSLKVLLENQLTDRRRRQRHRRPRPRAWAMAVAG